MTNVMIIAGSKSDENIVDADFKVENEEPETLNVIIVRYKGKKAGLVVDGLLGELQTVIKPLGDIFSKRKWISGSTILGTGEVAIIIDTPNLGN